MAKLVEQHWLKNGTWLRLVFQHPKGNLVTEAVAAGLRQVLAGLREHPALRLVTLEGAGDHFSYGASVDEHLPGAIERVLPQIDGLVLDLLAVPAPTAAIVRGRCLGGGFELALSCDFIFAADDAVLGLPEIKLGVFPPAGAVLLPLRAGYARAAEAILTGEPRPAGAWRDAGLVVRLAPVAELLRQVEEWFDRELAPKSATALAHAVWATRRASRQVVERVLPELERHYLEQVMRTPDAVEGLRAFLEKRNPVWAA
jgi:cyclohexa-1,5-dienecarbonyl-CoA hydratase